MNGAGGMKRDPEGIAAAIREAKTIAVCSHVNPDGDTVGCALAMRLGLQYLGKDVTVFCQDKAPDVMRMLPGIGEFRKPEENDRTFDLLLAVDVSDPERMGSGKRLMEMSRHTAQIDHHPTNPLYAEVNSVDGVAPAACLLIYEQLKTLGVPLTREIAMCLYTGISTDTGNFSYQSTNAEAFRAMAELIEAGLPLSEMSSALFREKSRAQVMLLGKALGSLRFECGGKVAVMRLTRRDFDDCHALKEHADTLVNYGLETTGTRMALLAREDDDGGIKFSLRAKSPMRVDDVAQLLGGGGHPLASGLTLHEGLDEAIETVLQIMGRKLPETDHKTDRKAK